MAADARLPSARRGYRDVTCGLSYRRQRRLSLMARARPYNAMKKQEKAGSRQAQDSAWILQRISAWLDSTNQHLMFESTLDGSTFEGGKKYMAVPSNRPSRPKLAPLQPIHMATVSGRPGIQRTQLHGSLDSAASYFPLAHDAAHAQSVTKRSSNLASVHSFVIGNLPMSVSSEQLTRMFDNLRHILPSFESAEVIRHPITSESLGYAKVFFDDERDKQWAAMHLQGLMCGGKAMHIYPTVYQTPASDYPGRPDDNSRNLYFSSLLTKADNKLGPGQSVKSTESNRSESNRSVFNVWARGFRTDRDFDELNWSHVTRAQSQASSDRSSHSRRPRPYRARSIEAATSSRPPSACLKMSPPPERLESLPGSAPALLASESSIQAGWSLPTRSNVPVPPDARSPNSPRLRLSNL